MCSSIDKFWSSLFELFQARWSIFLSKSALPPRFQKRFTLSNLRLHWTEPQPCFRRTSCCSPSKSIRRFWKVQVLSLGSSAISSPAWVQCHLFTLIQASTTSHLGYTYSEWTDTSIIFDKCRDLAAVASGWCFYYDKTPLSFDRHLLQNWLATSLENLWSVAELMTYCIDWVFLAALKSESNQFFAEQPNVQWILATLKSAFNQTFEDQLANHKIPASLISDSNLDFSAGTCSSSLRAP